MAATVPSRRWCRDVLTLRSAATELLAMGIPLTDDRVLRLSRRLDRLILDALPRKAPFTAGGPGVRSGWLGRSAEDEAPRSRSS